MIEVLLKNGADKSLVEECTPFEIAVNTDNFEVAEFLVKQGFPVRKREPMLRSVLDSPDLKQLLCEAVLNNNVKLAELIIKHGGDKYVNEIYDMHVNIRVYEVGNSISLLVIALKNKSKDMIRLLLSHHADPYLNRYNEKSPANFAEKMGDEWAIFLLGKDGYEEKKREDKEREEKYEKRRKEYERAWREYNGTHSNSQEGKQEQNDSDSEDEEFELPPAKYIEIPTEGTIEDKWKKIKKQYLLLTRQHHPDKGGDENIFKELNNEFHAIQNVMRNKYKDKIDVFHGGKRKQSTKKKLRNKNQRGKSMRR
jgi:hypothetical protein